MVAAIWVVAGAVITTVGRVDAVIITDGVAGTDVITAGHADVIAAGKPPNSRRAGEAGASFYFMILDQDFDARPSCRLLRQGSESDRALTQIVAHRSDRQAPRLV